MLVDLRKDEKYNTDEFHKAFWETWDAWGFFDQDKETDCPFCCPWDWYHKPIRLPGGVEPTAENLCIYYAVQVYPDIIHQLRFDLQGDNLVPEVHDKETQAVYDTLEVLPKLYKADYLDGKIYAKLGNACNFDDDETWREL